MCKPREKPLAGQLVESRLVGLSLPASVTEQPPLVCRPRPVFERQRSVLEVLPGPPSPRLLPQLLLCLGGAHPAPLAAADCPVMSPQSLSDYLIMIFRSIFYSSVFILFSGKCHKNVIQRNLIKTVSLVWSN